MAHCNVSWEQEESAMNTSFHDDQHPSMLNQLDMDGSSSMADHGFPINVNGSTIDHQSKPSNHFHPWVSPSTTSSDNLNSSPWDLSLDQIHIANSPMNFFGGFGQQFPPSSENLSNNVNVDTIFQGSIDSIPSDKPMIAFDNSPTGEHGYSDMAAMPIHQSLMSTTTTNFQPSIDYSSVTKDPVKQEMGPADSISDCSDDDGDQKVVGRSGRGHKSKNLVAERKRRKKLNDRLYALRALVPKITKMDRASILGDAIEFVKELQKQVKDLQDELEEPQEEDGDMNTGNNNSILLDAEHDESLNGSKIGLIIDNGTRSSSNVKVSDPSKQSHDTVIGDDKAQQMEVQVEVTQIDGNEFFLKVFGEHKPSGFVRLMEAMNSLGLEVTNANVTTFRGLVLNVFKVEKRDNEMVQADHVRDSLLELTRNLNPIGGWSEPIQASENYQNNIHHQHINSQHHNHLQSHHFQA